MFEGFQKKTDRDAKRRYAYSAGLSVFLYGALAAAALMLSGRPKPVEEEPKVEVVFRPPPPAEAPPPPPPKIAPRPPAVIPEGMKTRRVEALPPPTELVEPKKVPTEKLAEGNAEDDAVPVLDPSAQGHAGGREGGTAKEEAPPPPPPPPPVVKKLEPINLPEDATPPVEDPNNDHDGDKYYPAAAKAQGLEGLVILKIVITDSGEVGKITVLKGDEPFVAAAIAMIKSWHYSPALVEGKPQAVFKVLKIPFKLKS